MKTKNLISKKEELLGAPPLKQVTIAEPLAHLDKWKRLAVDFELMYFVNEQKY